MQLICNHRTGSKLLAPERPSHSSTTSTCRQDLGEVAQAAGIPHAGVPVTLDVVHAGADVTHIVQ